jgi:hypothetical protein
MVHILISERIVGGTACHLVYFPGTNRMNLIDDSGTELVLPTGVPPNTVGTLTNSRCSIDTALASRTITQDGITLTIPVAFQAAKFGGTRNVYVNGFDTHGNLSHWVHGATLNIR